MENFAIALLFLALISAGLMIYGWVRKSTPMGKSYSAMMLIITFWLVFYSLGLIGTRESANLYGIFSTLEYGMIVALPSAWLLFALNFSGGEKRISGSYYFLLLVLPVILFGASFFDSGRDLLFNHYINFGAEPPGFVPFEGKSLWFYIHISYSLLYFILGTLIVIRATQKNQVIDPRKGLILRIGVLIPWLGNITFIFRVALNYDMAPFTFVLAGILLAWGLFYNRFLNIIALAQKSLVEKMADGLVIVDSLNWVVDINLAAQSLFGTNRANVVGLPINVLFKNHPDLLQHMAALSKKNQEVGISHHASTRYFSLDINPLYADKGLLVGKFLLFKEITQIKETTQKWESAKNQAEQADNLKSAFLANLSHEIKTPMNAIMGFSELLNDESVSEEDRKEFIDHIRNSGTNLIQLIDDIIDVSKLDAGDLPIKKDPVHLSKMMTELFARFNELMREDGKAEIDLILDGSGLEEDLIILGDADRIRQVLGNLLSNAIKFTKKGSIRFGYKKDLKANLQFYVKDTGIGIPLDKHKMIFERFGRVANSNLQEYSGTGLGLSISQGLVKLMGGTIWFDSVYAKGTTFYFTLPLILAEGYLPKVKALEEMVIKKAEQVVIPLFKPEPEEVPEVEVREAPWAEKSKELEEVEAPRESIRDHIADLPEEADLIFNPEYAPSLTLEDLNDLSDGKVLVIEFDDMSYLYIEMILRTTKIQLIRAKTFTQGMNLLKGGIKLTGIVLAADLPDETLINSAKLIKEKFPRINIVAIMPFASETKRQQCLRAGCSNVLPKPLKQRELLAAIQNMYMLSGF